jgi:hypothetical protein
VRHERLEELLQAAVELELATIPPYLCALYSMRPEGNRQASLIVRSVVVEEMLHMVLAANVLNAIGGQPHVAGPAHAPRYPHELPDGVVLDLLPFGPEAVQAFLQVENPQYRGGNLSGDHPLVAGRRPHLHQARAATAGDGPKTIGAFYDEIIAELEQAAATSENALFCGDPARQVSPEYYYAGGGAPIVVTDLASARRALTEVVDQGEGNPASMYDVDGDLAHYYRFQQIAADRVYLGQDAPGDPTGPPLGVDYTAVFPMAANPKSDEYGDSDLREAARAANRTWSMVLRQVESACNGHPAALMPAVHAMFRLRDQMLVLLANPHPDHPGRNAGPTFEWHPTDE